MTFDAFFAWLQTTSVAVAISESVMATASLSSLHVLGFTVVMGAAIVSNLRLLGWLFPQRPIVEIIGPAAKGIAAGLVVSIVTGVLLFTARAVSAADNGVFQLKMLLLVGAAVFHFTLHRSVGRRAGSKDLARIGGAFGLMLWLALAVTACAYILFE
jgi:hypothetical protein